MEHSRAQPLVMEPPYILFLKNSRKHYEKQENIRADLLCNIMMWSDGWPCFEQEFEAETFWGPFHLNDSVIMLIISCTKAHTNSVTKEMAYDSRGWFYELSS